MKKILFIDDNPIQLKLVEKYFNNNEYQVISLLNPRHITRELILKVDVVLTDMLMPDLSGIDVLYVVRSFNKNLPVFMITAHSSTHLLIEFMKRGGTDYLEKPVDFEILKIKIDRALEVSLQHQKLLKLKLDHLIQLESDVMRQELVLELFHKIFKPLSTISNLSHNAAMNLSSFADEAALSTFSLIHASGMKVLEDLKKMLNKEEPLNEHESDCIDLYLSTKGLCQEIFELFMVKIEILNDSNLQVRLPHKKWEFILKYFFANLKLFSDLKTEFKLVFETISNESLSVTLQYVSKDDLIFTKQNYQDLHLLEFQKKSSNSSLHVLNVIQSVLEEYNYNLEVFAKRQESSHIKFIL